MLASRLLLALLPFVAASHLEKRANNCVLVKNSILGIDKAVKEMASAITNYNGGILGTKPIFVSLSLFSSLWTLY